MIRSQDWSLRDDESSGFPDSDLPVSRVHWCDPDNASTRGRAVDGGEASFQRVHRCHGPNACDPSCTNIIWRRHKLHFLAIRLLARLRIAGLRTHLLVAFYA